MYSARLISMAIVFLATGCTKPAPGAVDAGDEPDAPNDSDREDAGIPDGGIFDAMPDAFACVPDEFLRCDGDDAVLCNASGDAELAQTCELGCNASAGRCNECEPSTAACAADTLNACAADGTLITKTCPLGCNGAGDACIDVDPSNGLAIYLDMSTGGPELEIPAGATINTTSGIITDADGNEITAISYLEEGEADGVDIRVFPVKSLVISAAWIIGGPAVAFVSDGKIQVTGIVDVDAGRFSDPACEGDLGECENLIFDGAWIGVCGGGTGAGFGGRGGAPGVAEHGAAGFGGGNVSGQADLEPLRGGCGTPALSGPFGGGIRDPGGAIQLVSRSEIEFLFGGYLDLNGEGGDDNNPNQGFAGSGGASGGAALLEAPVVTMVGSSGIAANGGGGGGCDVGDDGDLSEKRAAGADCVTADGGAGGAGDTENGQRGGNASGSASAGSGGGGAGRIRINVPTGGFSPAAGAVLSPDPSIGTLRTR